MKRWLIGLLAVLVLTGCSQQPESTTAPTTPTPTAPPTGLYLPNSQVEQQTGGAVKVFPLGTDGCLRILPMGQNIVTVSLETNGATKLSVLSGEDCVVNATGSLEGVQASTIRASQDRIGCYSLTENCVLILDGALRLTEKIVLPDGIVGDILLNEDLSSVYFCTEGQIRTMDLATRIPRLLHEHPATTQTLQSVLLSGSILVCRTEDAEGSRLEFIDTQTGQTLGADTTAYQLSGWQDNFFLRRSDGAVEENLFRIGEGELQQLNVTGGILYGIPELSAAVRTTDTQSGIRAEFFDLATGKSKGITTIPDCHAIYSLCGQTGSSHIWFLYEDSRLSQDVLCRWDTDMLGSSDETVYTSQRYTAQNPDREGLAACKLRAEELSKTYDVQIAILDGIKPSEEYRMEPEFQVALVNQALDALETGLSSLPEGFVKTLSTVSKAPLQISLVRSMRNVSGQEPGDGTGLQYWVGREACIALRVTDTVLQDFYHQLYHLLDTYLYSESTQLDLWSDLNPKGFTYDSNYYNYTAHAGSPYLGENRAFIDAFSMTFPKEDRARIFEYAMLEGADAMFASETMQKKLYQLCYCIRDAYGLRRSELTYPWEQYLEQSLAYTKRK